MTSEQLELRKRDESKLDVIAVDFVAGAMAYRRLCGGVRGEAVDIKDQWFPDVVDATTGLRCYFFVPAFLDCRVRMFEHHPVMAAQAFITTKNHRFDLYPSQDSTLG